MIKVTVMGNEDSEKDMLQTALWNGSAGLVHIIGEYEHGYILADDIIQLDDNDDMYNIVSAVEHSKEGVITLGSGIQVEVVL